MLRCVYIQIKMSPLTDFIEGVGGIIINISPLPPHSVALIMSVMIVCMLSMTT